MAFAREGAKVAIADYVPEGGERTAKEIAAAGGEAIFIHADVAVGRQVDAMVDKIVQTGRGRLRTQQRGHRRPHGQSRRMHRGKFRPRHRDQPQGRVVMHEHEIPQMLKQGGGAIVNTASVAGLVGFRGLVAYNASKGGVVMMTKTAALEYAHQGIRVNAVCPGVIRTPMVARMLDASTLETYTEKDLEAAEPVGRMGKPEEIAEAVVWLCSEASSFVTGLPMAVDGGWIAQ